LTRFPINTLARFPIKFSPRERPSGKSFAGEEAQSRILKIRTARDMKTMRKSQKMKTKEMGVGVGEEA
jgi:hypothetical protein